MQIVIDIHEDLYKANINGLSADEVWDLRLAIKDGTPLPKGHGRLIDENDLMPDSDYEDGIFYAVSIGMIGNAPTIIEADKAGEEE